MISFVRLGVEFICGRSGNSTRSRPAIGAPERCDLIDVSLKSGGRVRCRPLIVPLQ
jgi:hypothetical protein